ncbi:uncharacterized protein WCC33_009106 [Rhinophrynus dorsalis]
MTTFDLSFRTSSEASIPDPPRCSMLKPYTSSYEVSRYVQRCQKERDEAFRREESARDKLKHIEATTRSQIQELKMKLKDITSENKTLHRTVKKLRLELGLEVNPKFKGKMTRDIIRELHVQEDQCSRLREDNQLLSVQLREMIPIIDQTQKHKMEIETKLESMENKLQELTNENNRISQLLKESQKEREELEKANLILKKSIEDNKQVTNRSVQTTTSIPVTLQSSYKRISRDTSSSQTFQAALERRKVSLEPHNSAPTDGSMHKAYYSTTHSQT